MNTSPSENGSFQSIRIDSELFAELRRFCDDQNIRWGNKPAPQVTPALAHQIYLRIEAHASLPQRRCLSDSYLLIEARNLNMLPCFLGGIQLLQEKERYG